MHLASDRPACWSTTAPADHIAPFWDGGRACANFATADLEARTLALTPGCDGCARADRARGLRAAAESA